MILFQYEELVKIYFIGLQISEADLLQVAEVMGLADDIDVTDDIGVADTILASKSELRQNPWIRSVAKFHQLPIFVIKVIRVSVMCTMNLHCSAKFYKKNKPLSRYYCFLNCSQIPWPIWSRQFA